MSDTANIEPVTKKNTPSFIYLTSIDNKNHTRIKDMGICAACGSNNCKDLINDVLVCQECDAVFSNKPIDNKTSSFSDTGKHKAIKDMARKIFSFRYSKLVSNEYVKYLRSKTDMTFHNALDIGALYGIFVRDLNNLGIDARGIEVDSNHVRLAVTDKITQAYFDENYKSEEKYDLICLTQMLYYTSNPYAVLKRAREMLTDNGMIFIATQNPTCTYIRNLEIPQLIEKSVNVFFSRKNFESIEGLKLVDYSTFKSNLQIDRVLRINEISIFLKYFFKKPYESDPNGNHAFVLLKPV